MIGRLTKRHEAVSLLPDRLVQRQALAAERMVSARFLIAVDQHLIAGLDKERVDLKAHQTGLVNDFRDRLGRRRIRRCGHPPQWRSWGCEAWRSGMLP